MLNYAPQHEDHLLAGVNDCVVALFLEKNEEMRSA